MCVVVSRYVVDGCCRVGEARQPAKLSNCELDEDGGGVEHGGL